MKSYLYFILLIAAFCLAGCGGSSEATNIYVIPKDSNEGNGITDTDLFDGIPQKVLNGSMTGYVVDSRTLAGLPLVNITAERKEEGNDNAVQKEYATTAANGYYEFCNMPLGLWSFNYQKTDYYSIAIAGSESVKLDSEHMDIPSVKMLMDYSNKLFFVKGILKDSIRGDYITSGNVNYTFANISFINKSPEDFKRGFCIPASLEKISVVIEVDGYDTVFITLDNLINDYDFGVINMMPKSREIIGKWKDVPNWVIKDAPVADIKAKIGNNIISSTTSIIDSNNESFILRNIPFDASVIIDIKLPGYRINSPICIYSDADLMGTLCRDFSLKRDFSPIIRDVRIYYMSSTISSGDRIGAYCEQTGTRWSEVTVTNQSGVTLDAPQIVDLGTQAMPTGYSFDFVGYIFEDPNGTHIATGVKINDDGSEAQIITVK